MGLERDWVVMDSYFGVGEGLMDLVAAKLDSPEVGRRGFDASVDFLRLVSASLEPGGGSRDAVREDVVHAGGRGNQGDGAFAQGGR